MADSPYLSDFLAKMKGSGAGTKASLLPPVIAPGLFSSLTGASEAGNYNSLNDIGQRIQQARADADQAYALKKQKESMKKLMDKIKQLQKQAAQAAAPSYSGNPGSPGYTPGYSPPGSVPSIPSGFNRNPGSGLNPNSGVRLPRIPGGGSRDNVLPPLVAPPRGSPSRPKHVRFPQIF